jgi:hypothetical protein
MASDFDVRTYFDSLVANSLSELRRLPPEQHAQTVMHFLTLLQGASGALVAAGLSSRQEVWRIQKEAAQPLYQTGHASPVEASASASTNVRARREDDR